MPRLVGVASISIAALLAACSSEATSPVLPTDIRGVTSTTFTASTSAPAPIDHDRPCAAVASDTAGVVQVVWIMMENHTRHQVLDNNAAPYERGLARSCASAADYHSVGSPSLPNYIGATSGSTQNVRDDGSPSAHRLTADNIFRQVRVSGRRAVSYEESMPSPCQLTNSGRYAVRHNPAAYFAGADDRDACARDDVPLGSSDSGALADAIDTDAMATFTFVTPDLCNDTHDCSVAVGDAWLARWVPRLVSSAAYRRGTMVVFIAWDEPSPMPFIAVTPTVAPGTTVTATIDHFALLRVTEQMLGLPLLGAAGQAADLRAALGR
jgi:hypothetical protein